MGVLSNLFGGGAAKDAAGMNIGQLGLLSQYGMNYLDSGLTNSTASVNAGIKKLDTLGKKYGGVSDLYLNALGVNGPEGNAKATGAFQAGPGYQWAVDQSTDALARKADALGMLNGGNTFAAISDRAGNMANQEYGNWLGRLAPFVPAELQATQGSASLGVPLAQLYQNDANAKVGLASNITQGVNNARNQSAAAEMQGAGNIAGFGMNLLNLGAGLAGKLGGFGGFGNSFSGLGGNPNMPMAGYDQSGSYYSY